MGVLNKQVSDTPEWVIFLESCGFQLCREDNQIRFYIYQQGAHRITVTPQVIIGSTTPHFEYNHYYNGLHISHNICCTCKQLIRRLTYTISDISFY